MSSGSDFYRFLTRWRRRLGMVPRPKPAAPTATLPSPPKGPTAPEGPAVPISAPLPVYKPTWHVIGTKTKMRISEVSAYTKSEARAAFRKVLISEGMGREEVDRLMLSVTFQRVYSRKELAGSSPAGDSP